MYPCACHACSPVKLLTFLGSHFLRSKVNVWQSSDSTVLLCRKRKVIHRRRSIGATCSVDARGIGSWHLRVFGGHTLSVYITFQSATGPSSEVCFVSVQQRNAGPLGHWLACGLVIMGELEMESLMMTMPVLPTLTYNEAVQLSYLLLHHGVPAFRATLCLENCLLLTLKRHD